MSDPRDKFETRCLHCGLDADLHVFGVLCWPSVVIMALFAVGVFTGLIWIE